MELQIVLIGAVVFVVSAVVIYLISAFTMKEKTFEEVIAEQKRQQEADRQKAKQEKHDKNKDLRSRFKKKKENARGDSSPKVSDTEVTKETKMVEIELDPEIIEPVEEKQLKSSKKKDKPIKSILHNKDEKTPIVRDDIVEDYVHRGPPPRDDIELKHLHDTQTKKDKPKKESKEKMKKEVEVKQMRQEPVIEEMMIAKETVFQAAAAPTLESRIPPRKSDTESSKLISSVKSASLNESEVQSLIETLLNKQGGSSAGLAADWNKKSQKGDPVGLLRKQLEEKERSLQEEQQMVMAANTKLKEIKQELNQEKLKFQSLEKSYKDKSEYQTRETQALQTRIQHAHEQHLVETSQLRAMIQKLESQAGDQSRLQRLAEENKSLRDSLAKAQSESIPPAEVNKMKQTLQIIQKELSNNTAKLNASENSKKTLEQKLAKAEAELKKYETHQSNTENLIQKRVDEVSQELRKSEAKNTNLNKDLKKAEQALDVAHKECVSLKAKLQELEKSLVESDKFSQQMEERLKESDRHKLDLDGNLKNIQKHLEDSEKEKSDLMAELQSVKQENTALSTELQTTRERQQGEGQEAPSKVPAGAQNGDVHEESSKEANIPLEEHEKILSEKVMKVHELTAEVENNKIEIANLQKDIETQKKKNNELREKNWKAMDALDKSENSVTVKVQSAIKQTRDELKTSQTEIENFDKSVLQRLFPEVSVSNKSVHKDWILEFEKQVSSHLVSLKQQPASQPDNCLRDFDFVPPNLHSYERCAIYQLEKLFYGKPVDCGRLLCTLHPTEIRSQKVLNQQSYDIWRTQRLTKIDCPRGEHYEKNRKCIIPEIWKKETSSKYETRIHELETKSAELEKQLKDAETKVMSLKQLESKSQALKKDLKATEASRDSLQSRLKEVEGSGDSLQSRLSEAESSRDSLQSRLADAESSHDSLQSRLEEAESSCSKLQSQISQYRNVLGETENKLTQLESSVETEEKKWIERLQAKELELEQTQKEVSSLKTEASKAAGSQEMKERISELEVQLNQSEDRCSQLETQLKETETKVTEYNVKIVELQSSSTAVTELNTELETLKTELQAEKKKNKDLASKIVILNGQIKSGLAALAQEQKLVEDLKTQLGSGDTGNSVPNDTNSEINKLRVKLAEKEKQFEKETSANKLLSQRLAASQGSLDEAGTSV